MVGEERQSAVCDRQTQLSFSSYSLPVSDWWSIREAEANIQGSAGFGPKQNGGGGVGGSARQ